MPPEQVDCDAVLGFVAAVVLQQVRDQLLHAVHDLRPKVASVLATSARSVLRREALLR
jgi:hypothetical protein